MVRSGAVRAPVPELRQRRVQEPSTELWVEADESADATHGGSIRPGFAGAVASYLPPVSRVLAAFAVDVGRPITRGLVEKATGLVFAARAAGHDVVAAFPEDRVTRFYREGDLPEAKSQPPRTRIAEAIAAAHRFLGFWQDVRSALEADRFDVLWLRAHPISRSQRRLLEAARESGGVRVAYDIPTYPFDRERPGTLRRLSRGVSFPLSAVSEFVEVFVTLSEHLHIEGVPTVRVKNGVSVAAQPRIATDHDGPTRLLGLGQWAYYHGLDRLLHAVSADSAAYLLRVAGDGPGVGAYATLANRLGIAVEWLPPVFGAERDALFDWADVGIGGLAIHRKGVYPDQALKHRVYAAAGLPFVCTTADPHWEGVAGVWQVPADESAIDGAELARRVKGFRQNAHRLRAPLREAARRASWREAYRPLFDHFDQA